MRQTIQIARVWGIPVGFNNSWYLIFAFLTWSLASSYMPQAYPDFTTAQYWILGTITSLLFFGSVLFHELAHAFFALRYQIGVKRITLFIFGGVAEMEEEPTTPQAEFIIAAGGPLASFIAAGFFYLIMIIPGMPNWVEAPALYLGNINLILALFNLIPGFPLDGGRILRAILWRFSNFSRATRIAARIGQVNAIIFVAVGIYLLLDGNTFNGIWLIFIGWFLSNSAHAHNRQAQIRDILKKATVRDIMQSRWPEVNGNLPISTLFKDHIVRDSPRYFFVRLTGYGIESSDTPHGMLTMTDVMNLNQSSWPRTPVQTIMTAWHNLIKTDPSTPLDDAVLKMEKANLKQMPVVENGSLVGVLTRDNVSRFITLQKRIPA